MFFPTTTLPQRRRRTTAVTRDLRTRLATFWTMPVDPEMETDSHALTFLQSARKRSTPASVSGWRTSLVMTA